MGLCWTSLALGCVILAPSCTAGMPGWVPSPPRGLLRPWEPAEVVTSEWAYGHSSGISTQEAVRSLPLIIMLFRASWCRMKTCQFSSFPFGFYSHLKLYGILVNARKPHSYAPFSWDKTGGWMAACASTSPTELVFVCPTNVCIDSLFTFITGTLGFDKHILLLTGHRLSSPFTLAGHKDTKTWLHVQFGSILGACRSCSAHPHKGGCAHFHQRTLNELPHSLCPLCCHWNPSPVKATLRTKAHGARAMCSAKGSHVSSVSSQQALEVDVLLSPLTVRKLSRGYSAIRGRSKYWTWSSRFKSQMAKKVSLQQKTLPSSSQSADEPVLPSCSGQVLITQHSSLSTEPASCLLLMHSPALSSHNDPKDKEFFFSLTSFWLHISAFFSFSQTQGVKEPRATPAFTAYIFLPLS